VCVCVREGGSGGEVYERKRKVGHIEIIPFTSVKIPSIRIFPII
jgi:hypothetical protein